MVEFDMLGMTSCSCAIATFCLTRAIFRLQIMSWPWFLGQTSLKVVESDIIGYIMCGFLLLSYSNFVPKVHHFLDIRLQKCRNFENRMRGP